MATEHKTTDVLTGVIVERVVTFDRMIDSFTSGCNVDGDAPRPTVPMTIRSNMGHIIHRVEVVVNGMEWVPTGSPSQCAFKGEIVTADDMHFIGARVEGDLDFSASVQPWMGLFRGYRLVG